MAFIFLNFILPANYCRKHVQASQGEKEVW